MLTNNAITLLNTAKSLKIKSVMNFKIQTKNDTYFICQPDSRPAVRPGCAKCMAPEFLHS